MKQGLHWWGQRQMAETRPRGNKTVAHQAASSVYVCLSVQALCVRVCPCRVSVPGAARPYLPGVSVCLPSLPAGSCSVRGCRGSEGFSPLHGVGCAWGCPPARGWHSRSAPSLRVPLPHGFRPPGTPPRARVTLRRLHPPEVRPGGERGLCSDVGTLWSRLSHRLWPSYLWCTWLEGLLPPSTVGRLWRRSGSRVTVVEGTGGTARCCGRDGRGE